MTSNIKATESSLQLPTDAQNLHMNHQKKRTGIKIETDRKTDRQTDAQTELTYCLNQPAKALSLMLRSKAGRRIPA